MNHINKLNKHKAFIIMLILSLILLCSCNKNSEQSGYADINNAEKITEIRLEDDYYGYQNYDFLLNNTIPADMYEYSYAALLSKETEQLLIDEIKCIVSSESTFLTGEDEKKIKALYDLYLDTEARNAASFASLEKGLEQLENVRSIADFVKLCGEIYISYGCEILPMPYFTQDHYDSSKYSAVIGQMNIFYSADELLNEKDTAENLQNNIKNILEILEYENADKYAYNIVTLLLEIAESTSDMTDASVERLYNVYTKDELSKLFNTEYSFINADYYIVYDPVQLEKISVCLTEENLSVWQALAECMLIYTYRDNLPEKYQKSIDPADNRTIEEKAISMIKQELAGEIGNIYSANNYDEELIDSVEAMAEDIRLAYRSCIEKSKLLSDSERREYLKKIDNMIFYIGCPQKDFHSDSQISGGLLESVISIRSSLVKENRELKGKTATSDDWSITPQTFNAVYACESNSVTIPMATFGSPFFDKKADYYTNLGGLGSIIAHEIGHAFDLQGILYDEKGNYRPERLQSNRTIEITSAVESYFGRKK